MSETPSKPVPMPIIGAGGKQIGWHDGEAMHGGVLLHGIDAAIDAKLAKLSDRRVLNLGCGVSPIAGAINHDVRRHSDHVDIAHNLNLTPWPIPDGRFDKVIALDVFEHLELMPRTWLAECWRILLDGGTVALRVSAWDNPVSYRDPTHRRVFHDETFHFFDPRHELWANYGRIYFPDGPWFHVEIIERGNADARYGIGDICAVLKKAPRPD